MSYGQALDQVERGREREREKRREGGREGGWVGGREMVFVVRSGA